MGAEAKPQLDTLDGRRTSLRILRLGHSERGVVAWLAVTPTAPSILAAVGAAGSRRAQERGLRIEETGRVSALRVVNKGDSPVLLTGDVILTGGLQTRILERSVIVGPRSQVAVPARCVERGRWAPGDGGGSRFELAGKSSLRMRRLVRSARARSFRTSRDLSAGQSRVWAHVDDECESTGSVSPTSSYEGYLRSVRAGQLESARGSGMLEVPPEANGALVLTGLGAAFELYPSHDALASDAENVVADLFDETVPPTVEARSELAARRSVERALAVLVATPLQAIAAVEGTLGEPRVISGAGLVGTCLYLDGALVHLAVSSDERARAEA